MAYNRKKPENEPGEHEHNWISSGLNTYSCTGEVKDYSEGKLKMIPCKCVGLTPAEFVKRKREWDEYFEKVKSTESYALFEVMRSAFHKYKNGTKGKDQEIMKEAEDLIKSTHKRVREIREENVWMPKPYFSDPVVEKQYKRLIILES